VRKGTHRSFPRILFLFLVVAAPFKSLINFVDMNLSKLVRRKWIHSVALARAGRWGPLFSIHYSLGRLGRRLVG